VVNTRHQPLKSDEFLEPLTARRRASWQLRWAERRATPRRIRALIVLLVVALIVCGIALATAMHRVRDNVREQSPGTIAPPATTPLPAPVRGAPKG
jgi:hypothetical protein